MFFYRLCFDVELIIKKAISALLMHQDESCMNFPAVLKKERMLGNLATFASWTFLFVSSMLDACATHSIYFYYA